MENYHISQDIHVFGRQVKSFPEGVGEAFDALVQTIPDGLKRSYFGISYMENEKVVYIAAAEEKENGEAEKFNCTRYKIEKGDYLIVRLNGWRTKTDTIKDIFHEMMKAEIDHTKPCVEWYFNDEQMLCMMKAK
jgi:hypothetical protein